MTNRTFRITIPATAGNSFINVAMPLGRRWRFLNTRLLYIANATVADRSVALGFLNPNGDAGVDIAAVSGVITASQRRGVIFHASAVASYTPTSALDAETYIATVNFDGHGFNGDVFYLVIVNGVAGDSFSGYALFEESE